LIPLFFKCDLNSKSILKGSVLINYGFLYFKLHNLHLEGVIKSLHDFILIEIFLFYVS